MIVAPINLISGINGISTNLGTLVIDNQGGTHTKGDYRCRMYRKGALEKYRNNAALLVRDAKPIRTGLVKGHARLIEPVHNLVLKSLSAMGYD